jgi:DUF1365 family protein
VVNSLSSLAHPVWIAEASHVSHTSLVEPRIGRFSYDISEQCIIDCSACPQYWWGGLLAEDHLVFSGPHQHIFNTMATLVARECEGLHPSKIWLITTLRAFGLCMNPISVYVCFTHDDRLLAYVYEVSNYPWGEMIPYVLDAREQRQSTPDTNELTVERKFRKGLHVSPWHPHPLERPDQYYQTKITLTRDPTKQRPFSHLHISLDLYDGPLQLFSSTWSIGRLMFRFPRPMPVALQTTSRILRQAANIHAAGRSMYTNVTNVSPPVAIQTTILSTVITWALMRGLPTSFATVLLMMAIFCGRFVFADIPLVRDIVYGWLVVALLRFIGGSEQ